MLLYLQGYSQKTQTQVVRKFVIKAALLLITQHALWGMEMMNQAILLAFIGFAGAIVGAVGTYLSTNASNKHKIKEIQLDHQHKLEDYERHLSEIRLKNARLQMENLYMPIYLVHSNLESKYYEFKRRLSLCDEQSEEHKEACSEFREACRAYSSTISGIIAQGKDAYLISEIEELLRSFNTFIRDSNDTNNHRILSKFGVGRLELRARVREEEMTRREEESRKKYLSMNDLMIELSVGIIKRIIIVRLIGLSTLLSLTTPYLKEEILAAPISSLAFEERISHDITKLKARIREVVLSAE